MTQLLLIYGANGYTGRLIVEEAYRRGLRPIIAGRSAESIEARELAQARRKAAGDIVRSEGRPTKRNRRQLHRFRSDND